MIFATHDWETTGLPFHPNADLSMQPRTIEFAGIITDGETIFDTLEFICNPGIAIEPIITKITGLTNSDLEDKPDFAEFIPKLKRFFAQADAALSHNLSFDKGMSTFDLARRGLDLSAIAWPDVEICTVEQTMARFGRRMKLIDLYEMYVGPYEQKHRAMDDVMVLHKVAQVTDVYASFNGLITTEKSLAKVKGNLV